MKRKRNKKEKISNNFFGHIFINKKEIEIRIKYLYIIGFTVVGQAMIECLT